jgi:hypothetical protein
VPTVTDPTVALIRTPEGITAQWLTTLLHAEGSLETDIAVVETEQTRIGEGVGVLSRIFRVRPTYSRSGSQAPATVIVKIATDNKVSRFTADLLSAFQREMVFYAELQESAPFVTARCFAAVQACDNSDFTLVMEDLGLMRFQDQLAGCTWDDSIAAIQAIAGFHAGWSTREVPHPELYLPLYNESYLALLPMLFSQNWPQAKELFADVLTPEVVAFGDTWGEHCEFMLRSLHAPYTTFVHGDWRADNVLFAPGVHGGAGESVLGIDFQLLGTGSGTYDVAYFVSQSIDPIVRAGRDRELVEVYVAALSAGGMTVDPEVVWFQYRVGLLFCLSYPVNSALAYNEMPDRAKQLVRSMLTRASTAISDTNAVSVLP